MIERNTKIKIEGIPEGYTERTHSGSNSIFYPKGKWNRREFEHTIKSPQKGMKSELIDGQYYWVCGCPDCAGIENTIHTRYHICDEHDNCVSCGENRKNLKHTPWGTSRGWRCKPCQDKINYNQKIEALEKFEEEDHDDWDFRSNDEIKCPHCGTAQSSDDRHEGEKEIECETCDGVFDLEVEYSVSYSTYINGERVTLKSVRDVNNTIS